MFDIGLAPRFLFVGAVDQIAAVTLLEGLDGCFDLDGRGLGHKKGG